jgi:integrase/recombinase XerD
MGTRDQIVVDGVLRNDERGIEDVSGAESDFELIELWLRLHPNPRTQKIYQHGIEQFMSFVAEISETLRTLKLRHLLEWRYSLDDWDYAPRTVRLRMSVVRSLLSFGQKTGYLQFNVGAALKLPPIEPDLTARILSVDEVRSLIKTATFREGRLLRFLYFSGARISETCGLRYRNVRWDDDGAVVELFGKGGKTRYVRLAEDRARCLGRNGAPDAFVFGTRTGKPLHVTEAVNMVRRAAKRAGIAKNVAPHWLRHSHVTHALDAGAPIQLVQQTVGHASMATTGMYAHVSQKESSGNHLSLGEDDE